MKCLNCRENISGLICERCGTEQENYVFANLDKLELKDILEYIFQSGQFEINPKIINSVFADLLINFPQHLYIYRNIFDEDLYRSIINLRSDEEAQRFSNIKLKFYTSNYGLDEQIVYESLNCLIESININVNLIDNIPTLSKTKDNKPTLDFKRVRITKKTLHFIYKVIGSVTGLSLVVFLVFFLSKTPSISGETDNIEETPTNNLVSDTQPPIIILSGEKTITISEGENYQELGATVIDNVDENIVATISGNVDVNTPGTYYIYYNAVDKSNNNATEIKRTIIVKERLDMEPPLIELNGENKIEIFVGETYQELGAVAVDNKDNSVTVETTGTVDTNRAGTYIIYYNAKDEAGNNANTIIRVVNVIKEQFDSIQLPIITLNGDSTITIEKDDEYIELGATAINSNNEQIEVEITGTVDSSVPGVYYIFYNTSESYGNNALEKIRKIIVEETSS